MQQQPTWKTIGSLQLSLPHQGYGDRLMQWSCETCGIPCDITGDIRLGEPIHPPEWWDARLQEEQRHQTPEAQGARRAVEPWTRA